MDLEPIAKWRWNEHMNRSIAEALSEIERETQVRLRCFDRWVSEGKLSRVDAWDRLERILSAVKHLRDYQTRIQMMMDEATAIASVSSPEYPVKTVDFAAMHAAAEASAKMGLDTRSAAAGQ